MNTTTLKFENVASGYGDTQILHGVSGSVEPGEVLGVFGRNGVGKTTLCKTLVGELKLFAGSVWLDGVAASNLPIHKRNSCGLGYMPQVGMVFDELTVRENLSLSAPISKAGDYFEIFPRLAERLDQKAGSMSGGERKILSFVRVMLSESRAIILDEPSEGVQPENIKNMEICIKAKAKLGCAIVLVEQNLNMLENISDHFLGLETGRVTFDAKRADCSRQEMLSVLSV